MNLALNLTEMELDELRRRTKVSDSADAVSCAAREFLRICRSRELMCMSGTFDYDENAWHALDQAELSEPWISIDREEDRDG
jgi:hypothetical protein